MAKFKIDVVWDGRSRRSWSEVVEADDATEALEHALPGSWRMGDFESATITISLFKEMSQ